MWYCESVEKEWLIYLLNVLLKLALHLDKQQSPTPPPGHIINRNKFQVDKKVKFFFLF